MPSHEVDSIFMNSGVQVALIGKCHTHSSRAFGFLTYSNHEAKVAQAAHRRGLPPRRSERSRVDELNARLREQHHPEAIHSFTEHHHQHLSNLSQNWLIWGISKPRDKSQARRCR